MYESLQAFISVFLYMQTLWKTKKIENAWGGMTSDFVHSLTTDENFAM